MMFGRLLAVRYAVPRQLEPTVWENTTVRTRPSRRASTVSAAISAAARPMPDGRWAAGSGPPCITGTAGGPVTAAQLLPGSASPGVQAGGKR